MPRISQIDEKRKELLPIVAQTFAELGYRRATTAELALRCEVRENILYRIWSDKKAMFIASIDYVYEQAASVWRPGKSQQLQGLGRQEQEAQHQQVKGKGGADDEHHQMTGSSRTRSNRNNRRVGSGRFGCTPRRCEECKR